MKWTDFTTDMNPKGKLQFGRVWRSADENYFKAISPLDPQIGKKMFNLFNNFLLKIFISLNFHFYLISIQ